MDGPGQRFAVTRELEIDELDRRYRAAQELLPDLTITDLLLRALALGFLQRTGRTDLDIGLAALTGHGQRIAVVRAVPDLDLIQLSAARRSAALRAHAGKRIAADDVVPVTALCYLGTLGVDEFTGVVPPGLTSLVTVGRIARRPVVDQDDGSIRSAATIRVTVNADARDWDVEQSARLLLRIAQAFAEPDSLLTVGRLTVA
jgi:pyruvate/2-oxoglutarate dehydrogenase complex dihydrolipoamide acyltransferase (E2) component